MVTADLLLKRIHGSADGRIFFVGDLHGCMPQLAQALRQVQFIPWRDKLVSVGDLTDRGPDSPACLALLGKPWFHAVRGNHEQMALAAMQGDAGQQASWSFNGGNWFSDLEISRQPMIRQLYQERVSNLPYLLEVNLADGRRIGVVHADLPLEKLRSWNELLPLLHREPELLTHLLWSRDRLMSLLKGHEVSTRLPGLDALVMGHTPIQVPLYIGNCAYIDTGCYHSGNLTLVEAQNLLNALSRD